MKRKIPVFVSGLLLGCFIGVTLIRPFFPPHALEETKIIALALQKDQSGDRPLANEMREYLRGRLYWNTARYLPSNYASGIVDDYGPIDPSAIEGIVYRKEPTFSHEELRRSALEKIR